MTAADDGETTRIRLDIAYDGTAFAGWARQPGLRTVQGELEAALATIFSRSGPAPRITVAGRTDAGVHALGQVAHVDLSDRQRAGLDRARTGAPAPADALARRLNGIAGLNADVFVSRASIAPAGFDARFSAVWRRYEYRVSDATGPRNPLERNRTLWHAAPLDRDRMNDAALSLIGLHDWAAYCKPRDGATTIRSLHDFRWNQSEDGLLIATVQADAFCHSMVRALAGATLAVGEGKLGTAQLRVLRDGLVRTSDFRVLPAKGLTLVEVGYPAESEFHARAEQTRARRPALVRAESAGTASEESVSRLSAHDRE